MPTLTQTHFHQGDRVVVEGTFLQTNSYVAVVEEDSDSEWVVVSRIVDGRR